MHAHHQKIQMAADLMQQIAGSWFKHNAPFMGVLAGSTGCGKTRLAKNVFSFVRSAGLAAFETGRWPGGNLPSSHYDSFSEMCNRVEEGAKVDDAMGDSRAADFLVLDDVGAETDKFKSGKHISLLATLLDRRESKWTVLTTNVHPDKWSEWWDIRVADRLMRNSQIVDMFDVPSYQTVL